MENQKQEFSPMTIKEMEQSQDWGTRMVGELLDVQTRKETLWQKLRDAMKGKVIMDVREVDELGHNALVYLSPTEIGPTNGNRYNSLGRSFSIPPYQINEWIKKLIEISAGRKVIKVKVLFELTEEEKKLTEEGCVCDGLVVEYYDFGWCALPIWGLSYLNEDRAINDIYTPGYYLRSKKGGKRGRARFERFKLLNGPRIDKQLKSSFDANWDEFEKKHPEIVKEIPDRKRRKEAV